MPSKIMINALAIALALTVLGTVNAVALNPQPEPPGVQFKRKYKLLPPNPCTGNRCLKQKVNPQLPPNPCNGAACARK